jgi:hypothetical protein
MARLDRIRWPLPVRAALAGAFLYAVIHSAQASREATLRVRILEAATGKPTPVRVLIEGEGGVRPRAAGAVAVSETAIPVPKQALGVMWGRNDRAEGWAVLPDGSFYADGAFEVQLPAGRYSVRVSKGYEYLAQTHALVLKPGEVSQPVWRLERWIDMPARGWYSADDHVHLQRSPRDDAAIVRWMAAEDVHVGNLLEMGDFWATYYTQYAFGPRGRYREGNHILSPGQEEPRTPEIGHTISLGARELVRNPRDYYSYDRVFDRVRELGGVSGFAHQGMSFHGYRGMTLNILRGKVDFLELAQFCVPEGPLALEHYYHFLDLGYRLTALAGSDFPWCGRGERYGLEERGSQIGDARFYTYVGKEFSFENWLDAVKRGHTFATTGPVLLLEVNGKLPGETLDVAPGARLRVRAEALGHREQVPLVSVEIVGHGRVLARRDGAQADRLVAEVELTAERGIWIAARCQAAPGQVAHTTPVYVTVNGSGFHNPETIAKRLELSESYLREIEQVIAAPGERLDEVAWRHKAALERQIDETRRVLAQLRSRFSSAGPR